jgi:hypothetical protein
MKDNVEIPVLGTPSMAVSLLESLRKEHDWVSVFWDRGWGDSGQKAEISIIVNGNGQKPLAYITKSVYKELLSSGVIEPNTLQTFKARRLHDFRPEEEKAS